MSSLRILVVDDFEPWRQRIRSILESGPKLEIIGEASDGLEAVQKAEDLKPDLILVDIGLPKLNGIETESRISAQVPRAKVLFLTENDDADVIQSALSNGAQAYVLKTNAGSELLLAIEAVCRGQKFVSRGINWDRSSATESQPSSPATCSTPALS